MPETRREFVPPFAELLDRMTVDQIKEVTFPDSKASVCDEMEKIFVDVDAFLGERDIALSSTLLAAVIALAQINLHIWNLKDDMQEDEEAYDDKLRLAHQLNGVRNQLKNLLMEELGDTDKSAVRTNFNTDGLEGWELLVLKRLQKT